MWITDLRPSFFHESDIDFPSPERSPSCWDPEDLPESLQIDDSPPLPPVQALQISAKTPKKKSNPGKKPETQTFNPGPSNTYYGSVNKLGPVPSTSTTCVKLSSSCWTSYMLLLMVTLLKKFRPSLLKHRYIIPF
ncbi:hypothetical protein NPIL_124551 [Nephila pilipes]|uniref:Uncharacterized protein n=1 Tax=Nephila pilipes TaxID=299642 RepID=A0A8X6NGR7_NEPPI|nr:hypothetical protein NPIL_124551 [Nephila pilipes]